MISPNRAENSKNIWNHHLDPTYEKREKNRALLLPLNWERVIRFSGRSTGHSMWISPIFSLRWEDEKTTPSWSYLQLQGLGNRPKVYLNDCTRMSRNLQKKSKKKVISSPTLTNCGVFEVCVFGCNHLMIRTLIPNSTGKIAALAVFPLEVSCSADAPCGNTTSRTEWSMKITIDWKRLYIYNSHD